jgi:hypothetical protein
VIAVALALGLAAAAVPEGAVRYRVEIAGERVGVADLAISCRGDLCAATWASRLRAPAEAGGAVAVRRVGVEVDRDGRWRGGRVRVEEGGAALPDGAGVPGMVPATLAEVALLSELASGAEACLEAFDEASGERGRICARRAGRAIEAEVLGAVRERIVPGRDGFPAEVRIADQGARFVADPRAAVPDRPPRLHGTGVAGPDRPTGPLGFCGVPADRPPGGGDRAALPPARAAGASCREKTARWLEIARAAGLRGRTAVGVAWDGAAFVWHAWAEVEIDGAWVPVDPTFRQSPARGPRFTVARYEPGDEAARAEAGRRVLACWGRARIERAR